MNRMEPKDLTKPQWLWRFECRRLRAGWMSRYNWFLYGAYSWTWFFVLRHYPVLDNEYTGLKVRGYWQITILGLSIGYCYRKDFNLC